MNLKNRTFVLLTAAALAVPAIAYAKHTKVKDSQSEIKIAGSAPAVPFTAVAKDSNIVVTDDGTNTIVKIDGTNLKTGLGQRDEHMKERVFKVKEAKEVAAKNRYIEVIVSNAKIDQGLKDHKVAALVKMGSTPEAGVAVTIENFSMEGDKVHGEINTTLATLGLKNVCKDIVVTKICVNEPLKITADIYIKK